MNTDDREPVCLMARTMSDVPASIVELFEPGRAVRFVENKDVPPGKCWVVSEYVPDAA